MRFHILGLPHTVSSKEYNACAYTQKVVKFGKMMTERGHEVIHYGHEDSDLICTEHVTVTTNRDLEIAYGNYDWRRNFFKFDTNDHAYTTFCANAVIEIGLRKQPRDFILPFWGSGVRPVCDAHPDIICVEPGIGYAGGHWARFKVFESYAIYHAYYGLESVGYCKQDWYDVVIPNYFDPEDFDPNQPKEDYFLYMGRVYDGKGVHIAIQATEAIGAKLIIAGQSSLKEMGYEKTPAHVTEFGYANAEDRKRLMARAKGAFVPSLYNEPFGGVQVEMLFSGTPTITTDWGAFTENNIHGVTGFRCRTFNDFVDAARRIEEINPQNCVEFANRNFSLDRVGEMYEKYFQDVLNTCTAEGWYKLHPVSNQFFGKHIPNHPLRCDYTTINDEEKPQADNIAKWVAAQDTTLVYDIGCGPGTYVESLRNHGVNAYGFDIDDRVDGKTHLTKFDFTKQTLPNPCDLAICLEVAEHIDEKYSDVFVSNVVDAIASNGLLVWTAAVPGQGGIGHINCQPKEYWEQKLCNQGLTRVPEMERELIAAVQQSVFMGWFINNLMVFRKA